MSLFQLVLLALIQGITEFLPISSSAHLILLPKLTGWQDQGAMIDLMAHFGSLFAVLLYFRKDVAAMFTGAMRLLAGDHANPSARLFLMIVIATPPVLISGLILKLLGLENLLRHIWIIIASTLFFALLLWWADVAASRDKKLDGLSLRGAGLIGLSQALALIPGTSRSGITMTAGLYCGLTRPEAARFSMLMSLPVITLGGLLAIWDLSGGAAQVSAAGQASLTEGFIVAILSFVSALAAIHLLLKWLQSSSFLPFVLYRFALAGLLIIWTAL